MSQLLTGNTPLERCFRVQLFSYIHLPELAGNKSLNATVSRDGDSDVDGNLESALSATTVVLGKVAVISGDCETGCTTVFGNKALFSTGDEPSGAVTIVAFNGFGR